MKKKKYLELQSQMEKEGRFDEDYLPYSDHYIIPDGNFKFVRKNIFYKTSCAVCRTITFLLGPVVCAALGLKVRGKQNVRQLKGGAICICNHIGYLDSLYVKQAVGHYRSYHTGAPKNNKSGFGGFLLRRAGFLSLGGNIAAMRNFKTTVGELLKKGAIINYYPEHALWQKYEKPRPMKSGAFKTAAAFGVPVLPMFVTFEGKRKHPVINILSPIFPDTALPERVAAQQMAEQASEMWKETYEKVYGKALVFEVAEDTQATDDTKAENENGVKTSVNAPIAEDVSTSDCVKIAAELVPTAD